MFLSEYPYSSIAQSVEHSAVNRRVVGSSPTGGAKSDKSEPHKLRLGFVFLCRKGSCRDNCVSVIPERRIIAYYRLI